MPDLSEAHSQYMQQSLRETRRSPPLGMADKSERLAALRRSVWLTSQRDLETLYKAQVRSVLEYAPLAWGGAAPTHLALLDRIQHRAEGIMYGDQESNLAPLQTRRDVAGLAAMYRAQELRVEHLQAIRLPPRPVQRVTREALRTTRAVAEPRCHTLHHQRQYAARYAKKWNEFWASTDDSNWNLQSFKRAVNSWLTS